MRFYSPQGQTLCDDTATFIAPMTALLTYETRVGLFINVSSLRDTYKGKKSYPPPSFQEAASQLSSKTSVPIFSLIVQFAICRDIFFL